MFVRSCWKPNAEEEIFDLIDHYPWALVVNNGDTGPYATNMPVLLDRTRGEHGTLVGHIARANDHAEVLQNSNHPTLVIFHGPYSYVTGSWYPNRDMPSTVYYTAVHCYGKVQTQSNHQLEHWLEVLTNRMEEAIGDATNIHLMYPGLVYCFFHVLKANRAGSEGIGANDIAMDAGGSVVASIQRYHDVLLGLTGRRLIRDEFSRYETVSLALVDPLAGPTGHVVENFPSAESVLRAERFFPALLQTYDLRYPYTAPSVSRLVRRCWSPNSPAFRAIGDSEQWLQLCGYQPRVEE